MTHRALVAVALLLSGSGLARAAGETEKAAVTAVAPLLGTKAVQQQLFEGIFYTQAETPPAAPGKIVIGRWGSGRESASIVLKGPLDRPESVCRTGKGEVLVDVLPGVPVYQRTVASRRPSTPSTSGGPFADDDGSVSSVNWRVLYPKHCAMVWASFDGDDPENRRTLGRVQALARALHAKMESSGLSKGRADVGKPLCDEALRFFGLLLQPSATHIRADYDDLEPSFLAAVARYDRNHPGAPSFATTPPGGSASALNWLFAEGGTAANLTALGEGLSEEFVFTDRTEAGRLLSRQASLYGDTLRAQPGTEGALLQAIVTTSERERRRLTPGDVFFLALEQTSGDSRHAMLMAHNTVRSLARGADASFTGVAQNLAAFEKYLAPIRGGALETPELRDAGVAPEAGTAGGSRGIDGPRPLPETKPDPFAGDNAGPWYHLFGTAFFEMQVQGELGSVLADALDGTPAPGAAGLVPGKVDPTSASQVANALEQYYRELLGRRVPDPEKYCFNVWGARIGAKLGKAFLGPGRRRLGPLGARDLRSKARPPAGSPTEPGVSEGTRVLPPPKPESATPKPPSTESRELREARAEKQRAFEAYTRLVTEGGPGDVQKALEEYRAANERLKQLEGKK